MRSRHNQAAPRTTVLLLDTSDPLSPKHAEELKRLVREFKTDGESPEFHVAPGEKILVYRLQADLAMLEPVLELCNPGDRPGDWTWDQHLTQGIQIKIQQWRQFDKALERFFTEISSGSSLDHSPILETLGVLAVRHAPSSRQTQSAKTHLVVFSDLLQHSSALSHYGTYPDAEQVRSTPGMRQLHVDLANHHLSLFRLERPRDARFQSVGHYYWWTKLVQAFGGQIVRQESI